MASTHEASQALKEIVMSMDSRPAPHRRPDRNRLDVTWRVLLGFVVADTLLWLALPLWW